MVVGGADKVAESVVDVDDEVVVTDEASVAVLLATNLDKCPVSCGGMMP